MFGRVVRNTIAYVVVSVVAPELALVFNESHLGVVERFEANSVNDVA